MRRPAIWSINLTTGVTLAAAIFTAELAACAPAQECAFVANHDSGTVSVIDTTTNAVTRTIQLYYYYDPRCLEAPIPGAEPQNIAVSPDGTRAYVTMFGACYLTAIDTRPDHLFYHYIYPYPAAPRFMNDLVVSPSGDRTYDTASYALLGIATTTPVAIAVAIA